MDNVGKCGAAVGQEVEQVVPQLVGQWFDPQLLQSACRGVLG